MKDNVMKNGVRGKFYHPKAKMNLPVYLAPDVADFIKKLSRKKGNDVENIVNDRLRKDIGLIQSIK
jgi:hypothetical protein